MSVLFKSMTFHTHLEHCPHTRMRDPCTCALQGKDLQETGGDRGDRRSHYKNALRRKVRKYTPWRQSRTLKYFEGHLTRQTSHQSFRSEPTRPVSSRRLHM